MMKLAEYGFPLPIVKLLNNYRRSQRAVIITSDTVFVDGSAKCGLPTGSGYADLSVQASSVDVFDSVLRRNPEMLLDTYYDDLFIDLCWWNAS